MPTIEQFARLTEPPKTWPQAVCRTGAMIAVMFPVVMLDEYFHTAAFAAVFGYVWGGLSVYGLMRGHGQLRDSK